MIDLLVEEKVELSDGGGGYSDIEHYYCDCDSDKALCGEDLTDAEDHSNMYTPEEDDCVVCVDLIEFPCVRCGKIQGKE